jgi:hypothetical protein
MGILIAALAALHVLSAEGGLDPSAVMSATSAERSVQNSTARSGPDQAGVEVARSTSTASRADVAVTTSASDPGVSTGAHLQGHGAGDCVLFPTAGLAIVVLLMECAAARALRCRRLIARRWMQVVTSIAARRGPPPRHRPRIALCVMRV